MKAILDTGLCQYLFDDVRKAAACAELLGKTQVCEWDSSKLKYVPLKPDRLQIRTIRIETVQDSRVDVEAFKKAKKS
jgi:hypothetical protein